MDRLAGFVASVVLSIAASVVIADEPVFDVPRLEGVTIDGVADDWGDRGMRVEVLLPIDKPMPKVADHDAAMRLGWDEQGLLVLVRVSDNAGYEAKDAGAMWQADALEVFMADRKGGQYLQWLIGPGIADDQPALRTNFHEHRTDAALKAVTATIQAARTRIDGGYIVEAKLPWDALAITPGTGASLAFQLYVTDSDGPNDRERLVWHPSGNTSGNSNAMHRIRLSDAASAPVLATARGDYEQFSRIRVDVIAGGTLAGQRVQLARGPQPLGAAMLSLKDGRASATLRAPLPTDDAAADALVVKCDNAAIATIDLPDLAQARSQKMLDSGPVFSSAVFSGEAFPTCEFEQPLLIEKLIGLYTIDVTFLGRDYQPVTTAATPGRYGAVIRVTAQDGRMFTRYRTIYRASGRLEPWKYTLDATMRLPEHFGIDPAISQRRSADIAEAYKWSFHSAMEHGNWNAILLAGLSEMDPADTSTPSVYSDAWSRDRAWWLAYKRHVNGNDQRYTSSVLRPQPFDGRPALMVRDGTLEEAGMKPDATEKIDAVLTAWAADTDEAFIACVVRHGVIVLHKAYGTRDGKPMTTDTKSSMASLSKLVSGTQIMMLVDQGLIDLDTPINAYLPELHGVTFAKPITMRHLYTHTAGMWSHRGEDDHDLEELVAEYGPLFKVGEKYEYDGMGMELGLKILEQVTGLTYPQFALEHLLKPLGCEHTDALNASWNTQSTALDMARIGQMLLNRGAYGNQRFMSEQTFESMLPRKLTATLGPDATMEYGIGCSWFTEPGLSDQCLGHGAASNATLRIDLKHDLVISMTRNAAGRNFATYHPRFIEAVVQGMAETAPAP